MPLTYSKSNPRRQAEERLLLVRAATVLPVEIKVLHRSMESLVDGRCLMEVVEVGRCNVPVEGTLDGAIPRGEIDLPCHLDDSRFRDSSKSKNGVVTLVWMRLGQDIQEMLPTL